MAEREPARAGVRGWVRSAGTAVRAMTPAGIVTFLAAAAVTPVAIPLIGGASAAIIPAVAGLLGGMGGNYLADVLVGTAERLRRRGTEPTAEELRDALAADLLERFEDPGLRADLARLLERVGAAEEAVTQAGGEVAATIRVAIGALAVEFAEFGGLLTDLRESLAFVEVELARADDAHHEQITRLTDAATLAHRRVLTGHGRSFVLDLAFAPDGKLLASTGSDTTVRLWDVTDGTEVAVIEVPGDKPYADVEFSPDGKLLALGPSIDPDVEDDNFDADDIALVDVATRRQVAVLPTETETVHELRFTPDGSVLVGAMGDGTLRSWRVSDGRPLAIVPVGTATVVYGIALSSDGSRLVSGTEDGVVTVWRLLDGGRFEEQRRWTTSVRIGDVDLTPDGTRVVVSGNDENVRLWNADTGALTAVLRRHADDLNDVTLSPDGRNLVSAGADTTAYVWDVDPERAAERLCRILTEPGFEQRWRDLAPEAGDPPVC